MKSRGPAVMSVLLAIFVLQAPAAMASGSVSTQAPTCPNGRNACVGADGDGWLGSGQQGGKGRGGSPNPAGAGGTRPVVDDGVRYRYVPTCSENNPLDAGMLCLGATTSCPEAGQIRFWVYTRRVTPENPEPPWQMVTDPPFVCRGVDETPEVDPRVAIAGMIEREFQRVVVVRGVAEINPAPQTLVHVATRFETPTVERYDIPLTLLGQSVVITAQAERWTWHTGDGATVTTTRKGTRGRVEHTYTTAGSRSPYVVISWSGTYSVNGESMGAVPGTVATSGEPGSVDVRQARTELVGG